MNPSMGGDSLRVVSQEILVRERSFIENHLFGVPDLQLQDLVLRFFRKGGEPCFAQDWKVRAVFRDFGFSGFEYRSSAGVRGRLALAPVLAGGFVVHKLVSSQNNIHEAFYLYSDTGELKSIEREFRNEILFVELIEMEPLCPILSLLYNFASHQYEQANLGLARIEQMTYVEGLLRFVGEVAKQSGEPMSYSQGGSDQAIEAFNRKIVAEEEDTTLTWEERQKVYELIKKDRAKVIRTKQRVHKRGLLATALPSLIKDLQNFARRIRLRPTSNIGGLSYRYSLGILIWFVNVIRGNIGYSIALALYGPFTFYFITQPLNPHAMWAVGKVRSAYLDTVQTVDIAVDKVKEITHTN